MQRYKLARVRWHVGQTLLPEHFTAQEEALDAEVRLHASLSGLPSYGVAALAWNESLLSAGSLSISSLTVVMKNGAVVDVPGNAVLPPLSLDASGRSEFIVYLHVLRETTSAEGVRLYADDPPVLQRVLHRLQLSSEPVLDGAVASMGLAAVSQDEEGAWAASPDWVPPLLLVGTNPFLEKLLAGLDELLDQVRQQLLTHISDTYLRSDRLTNARRALFEVHRLQALRKDMTRQVYPHPYHLFDSLRRVYFESCCYLEMLPDEQMPVYQHEDLSQSLGGWMRLLTRSFQPEATRSTHKAFAVKDGQFLCSPLPPEVRTATEMYLLVQRTQPGARTPLDGVKLASPSRLPLVRRQALKGVTFTHVPFPSFPHALGPEIDWYVLGLGEEWQHALREDGVAFYVTPALKGAQTSLFWRRS
ncbi:type VI secretion system baseplate subunit TssK [Myxococcaceae bacterium JPH2]|nr:type VI secretion system baseplate subunit TssK [Myxococcaceae bacterium JPH2]